MMLDASFDAFDDNYSNSWMQLSVLDYNEDTIPNMDNVTSSTIMYNITDKDSVRNASLAILEIYDVKSNNIKFCFRRPKIISNN